MAKEIIVADNAGFCFGVKRAVDTAARYYREDRLKVYTLGPLIHNNDVIRKLEEHGIRAITPEQIDDLGPGSVALIRSHGVAPQTYERIKEAGADVVDATCPYVAVIHKKVEQHYRMGYQIVIVGDRSHPEVEGINGWCGNSAIITRDGSDLPDLDPEAKVCVVAQTTERLENYEKVLAAVKSRCRHVAAFNTICTATKNRQESAAEVARQVDLMIVIGSKNSSNTRKLVEISKADCENTFLVENRSDLPMDLIAQERFQKIGITAGASTPDWVIADVIEAVRNL